MGLVEGAVRAAGVSPGASPPLESARPGRILVTGFEPFDGHALNVSWEVARALDERVLASTSSGQTAQIAAVRLPCRFGACITELAGTLSRIRPTHVLCLGQAEGRPDITVERVALNLRDARIADNAGYAPIDEPVVDGGPYAYPSGLPVRGLTSHLRREGYPVSVSNSAGTFVCNDLFYGLMHAIQNTALVGGFIHLPILPSQRRLAAARSESRDDAPHGFDAATPALALDVQVAAIEAALKWLMRSLDPEAVDVA